LRDREPRQQPREPTIRHRLHQLHPRGDTDSTVWVFLQRFRFHRMPTVSTKCEDNRMAALPMNDILGSPPHPFFYSNQWSYPDTSSLSGGRIYNLSSFSRTSRWLRSRSTVLLVTGGLRITPPLALSRQLRGRERGRGDTFYNFCWLHTVLGLAYEPPRMTARGQIALSRNDLFIGDGLFSS
jgi:hypothetical protein